MSIRNILLVIPDGSESAAALDAATALATAHDAHLIALTIGGMPAIDYGYGYGSYGGAVTAQFTVEQMEAARERVDNAAEKIREQLSRAEVGSEARSAARSFSGIADEVAHHGRHADLILISRAKGEESEVHERAVDGALFDSGRPLVLLPSDWSRSFGERIVVAWDGGREAARAIGAAMPLIERASEVRIALVDPKTGDYGHGQEPGADLGAALSRHNRNVSVDRLPALDRPVSRVLLDHASDTDADLLVLGAYGHSRLAESIFGGVTHDMLRGAPLPLLMAH